MTDRNKCTKMEELRKEGAHQLGPLIEKWGGNLSQAEVTTRLGIFEHEVNNLRMQGELLAILHDEDYIYPAFQFLNNGLLPHLSEIINLLDTESSIAKIRFFLSPFKLGCDDAVVVALQKGKDLDLVRRAAQQFGKQGAR